MLAHLLGLVGYLGIPFCHLLGPFILWHTQKEKSPFIDFHGKESLNFQITVFLAMLCLMGVTFVLMFLVVGIFLIPVIIVASILAMVAEIMACVAASRGEWHRYPCCLRLF